MADITTQQAANTSENDGKNAAAATEAQSAPAAETAGEQIAFTPAQQAHIDRVIEDRLARQRTQHQKAQADEKARLEAQRLAEQGEFKALADQRAARIAELESELKTREVNTLRATVAARHKLPEHWITRLVGDTEAEIDADAARIAKDLAPPKAPNSEGGEQRGAVSKADARAKAIEEAKRSGRYAA